MCEFLIHRGANPAARDNSGKTALDVAKGDAVAILRNEAKIEKVGAAATPAAPAAPAEQKK